MSQYRPSSLIPSTLTSTYTIDATVDNNFSCIINGNSATTKYRLKIMSNDASSTIVYDTGVVTLSSPIYPVSYDGTQNQLIVTVPSTSGMVNGNEYKWTIDSYWTEADHYVSYDVVFKAYAAPVLTITTVPATITSKSYTFTATCTQAQNVAVEKFGWILKNIDTGVDVINTIDQNNIYSSDLKLVYDGFLNGNHDEIKIKCWLTNGVEVETAYSTFSVTYVTNELMGGISLTQTTDSGVLANWSNVSYIYGVPLNSKYSYVYNKFVDSYCINLNTGNTITYDKIYGVDMSISTNASHIISFGVASTSSSLYKASGLASGGGTFYIELKIDNGSIVFDNNGTTTSLYTIGTNDFWFIAIIEPTNVKLLKLAGDLNGLYPSTILYPSNTLYPVEQTYSVSVIYDAAATIPTDGTYSSMVISGYQFTNYLWVISGNLSTAQYNSISDFTYEPEWDLTTTLLATFNNTLSAGSASSSSVMIYWNIYRLDSDVPTLKFVERCIPKKTYLVDYMVRNMVPVKYYVFPEFMDQIGEPLISDSITPSWWSWNLITCDTVEKNTYTVNDIFKFDLDVTSDTLTNNTSFNVLENFTKYAKIQNSNSNYWSGSITALIGNECDYENTDNVEKMNKLKNLSTDGLEKFIKDRKGNIWKVHISNAISEKITDEYKEQAVSVTLNWSESESTVNSKITENPSLSLSDISV